mgnify:FL=1
MRPKPFKPAVDINQTPYRTLSVPYDNGFITMEDVLSNIPEEEIERAIAFETKEMIPVGERDWNIEIYLYDKQVTKN